jgi:hypothetical protein
VGASLWLYNLSYEPASGRHAYKHLLISFLPAELAPVPSPISPVFARCRPSFLRAARAALDVPAEPVFRMTVPAGWADFRVLVFWTLTIAFYVLRILTAFYFD